MVMKGVRFGAAVAVAIIMLLPASAHSQEAIRLQPFPKESWSSIPKVHVTTTQNFYGRCGSAVVQVLGVERQVDDFYTVDSAADGGRVVVIGDGGRRLVMADQVLSDHNGVACLQKGRQDYLLVWSNCGGTACGDDFAFTVLDVRAARIVAGGKDECDDQCARRITGSSLPMKLNGK